MILFLVAATALGATLEGRVVDAATGSPVVGATIEAWDPRLRGSSSTTLPDGSFLMTLDSSGPWRLRAVPRYNDPHVWRMADGGTDFCLSEPVLLEQDLHYGDIVLPTGHAMTGRVQAPDGTPLAGATVWASPAGDVTNFDRPAITDSDGEYTVVGLDTPEVGSEWLLEVSADDLPVQFLGRTYDDELAEVVTLESDTTVVADIEMLPGIRVGGLVEGPDGPVAEGVAHAYSSSQVVTVTIDATGRYDAIGIPPGDVITWANSPGLAQTYYPDADRPSEFVSVLDEGEERDDIDLYLAAESVFTFELVDAQTGAPVPLAGGLLYNDTRTVGLGDSADEDGILRIDRLHAGDWLLYIWGADEGYADDWVLDEDGSEAVYSIEPGEERTVVLPLQKSARIAGIVIDDDGNPVDGIAIAAIREDQSGLATTTAPDGTFVLGGLMAGEWTFSAEYAAICPGDPGYVPTFWPGTPNRDWARTLTLQPEEQRIDVVFKVPRDADLDEMADAWERSYGLDPNRPEDAWEDPDGDAYTNLEEYRMGTDPFDGTPAIEDCGCHVTATGRHAAWYLGLLPLLVVRVRSA